MPGWDASERQEWEWVALPSRSPEVKGPSDTVAEAEETRAVHAPDPAEASLIAGFFNQLTASLPLRFQSVNGVGPSADLVNSIVVVDYVNEDPGSPAGPTSGEGLRIAPLPGPKYTRTTDEDAVHVAANVEPIQMTTMMSQLLFTRLQTIVNGISTTIPAYIIPKASTVLGPEAVTLNGILTTLSVPDLLATYIPTTINGVPTSTLVYFVNGQTIATVGQTVTLDGRSTVLEAPEAVFAQIQTTVDGVATTTPVYIIRGSSTALIGQNVVLDGKPSVLAAPDVVPTLVTTTVDGIAESRFVYVLSTSSTASIGETVALDRKTTVLSEPTEQPLVHGGAAEGWSVSWSAALIGLSAIFVAVL
ncbi:hypothetical protein SVAN01_07360 [Stagonosporopsis vannaccii]|nr:hypothetical protein SVAN01_07360 [Stagonosporopsis vannaccii]